MNKVKEQLLWLVNTHAVVLKDDDGECYFLDDAKVEEVPMDIQIAEGQYSIESVECIVLTRGLPVAPAQQTETPSQEPTS